MEDSNIQELYEFLSNYNLIQSNISDEVAEDYIDHIFDSLEPEETLLTGFIADTTINDNVEPRAYFITNQNRMIGYPQSDEFPSAFNTENVELIEEASDNSLRLKLKDIDQDLLISAQDMDGIDTINDALYSSFAESLDDDQLDEIFGEEIIEEPEAEIEEAVVETEAEPEDGSLVVSETSLEVPEMSNVPEVESTEMVISNTGIEQVNVSETDMVEFSSANDEENLAAALPGPSSDINESGTATEKKKFHLTKPMIYTIAGIGVLALILVGYLLYSNFAQQRKNQEMATTLVDYLNQSDSIYFTLRDYQNANFAGATVEKMDELNNQAQQVSDGLLSLEANEDTDELYQDIYFYNDSLLSSIYYGRVFITTQNQLNRLSFDSMLDYAYRYRISILKYLRKNYPDLLNNVENEPDMDLDAEFAESEQNSEPSPGALNRENSVSSNEALENSVSSRENYMNSKSSRENAQNSRSSD